MSGWDWGFLIFTLLGISAYGIYKGRSSANLDGFLRAGQSLPWYHVGLSVMATQASAITFLAGPGFGYAHGLQFIQFYLGLPLAVLVLCISFVPNFYKMKVYTAYEYLEGRFDFKTRTLSSILFLVLRALSTSISVYAPALILSSILKIPSLVSTLMVGGLVIGYTFSGGAKAVSYTQVVQMLIIFTGLFTAIFVIFNLLPQEVHLEQVLKINGLLGHLNALDFHWNLHERYNIWSGLLGGFFLQLSYFGTDQSQVSRYLTGSSIKESKMGLILNGLIKIPMQFLILMTGVLIFTFYQFHKPPLIFNPTSISSLKSNSFEGKSFIKLEGLQEKIYEQKKNELTSYIQYSNHTSPLVKLQKANEIQRLQNQILSLEKKAGLITSTPNSIQSDDSNYVFLHFILTYLPKGLVGALIAIIFLSSMGAVASALNSMTSCSVVDIYKRWIRKNDSEVHYVNASKAFTLFWGLVCVFLALFIGKFDNLIEAVNIIGSFVYGPILGIFLVAFYLKWIRGNSVFYAAILSEIIVILFSRYSNVAYLWWNVLGSVSVMILSILLESTIFKAKTQIKN